jgi:hypothetical protein
MPGRGKRIDDSAVPDRGVGVGEGQGAGEGEHVTQAASGSTTVMTPLKLRLRVTRMATLAVVLIPGTCPSYGPTLSKLVRRMARTGMRFEME